MKKFPRNPILKVDPVCSTETVLTIDGEGEITAIWDDSLAGLVELAETVDCRRASHVEMGADGLWYADLSPVGGPVLPGEWRRADALAAERAWLREHLA